MNVKAKAHIRNEYYIKCIDERTGEVTHNLNFHNVVLNQIVHGNTLYTSHPDNITGYGIAIGKGSGTPAATDTGLFSQIKTFTGSGVSRSVSKESETTMKETLTYTIPADASNVYDITEIGILMPYNTYTSSILVTHAMVLDSEGNPITIHKTDTDKVIITCELYVTLDIPGADFVTITAMRQYMSAYGGLYLASALGLTCSPEQEIHNYMLHTYGGSGTYWFGGAATPSTFTFSAHLSDNVSRDAANRKVTITVPTRRLLEYPMQVYLKGVVLCGSGVIKLPNEDIFPRYNLTGIDVGVGDGSTTEFKCPLNYFIKDTDVVYVNGTPLTRGVDYAIENDSNQDELVELSAGNDAIITGGNQSDGVVARMFRRNISNLYYYSYYAYYGGTYGPAYMTSSTPVFFDFGTPRKVNTLRIGPGYSGTYTLYGRNSEEDEWTQITSIVYSSSAYRATFETVTYRYMKLTTTGSGSSSTQVSNRDSTVPTTASTNYNTPEQCNKNLWFLGYVGEGIKFTTPPAADALITMDAYTDLPMLSPNSVLDLSTEITLQF